MNTFRNAWALAKMSVLALLVTMVWGQDEDPLKLVGAKASQGAAAGYVADKVCASCHAELYKSYQHVGMAKSFAKPSEAEVIEDFGKTFYHKPSQRYYEIHRKGDEWLFRRFIRDEDGEPINVFEQAIDWVMGSGNRARSYLYRNEWGELYELPLGWYSEDKKWEMSPGFEIKNHQGVLRQVRRECMYCHNAYPEVPAGSDNRWLPHRFPEELPQGTGCQRCHGPGAEHIRSALKGSPVTETQAKIVNPRKLEPEARDSVCFQCHMLPSVAMVGPRRFDRPVYSFRPGQRLSDYQVTMDVVEPDIPKEDRFEINHHGYRFWMSKCYQKSKGELACISCHNPHVKPNSKVFRASVGEVCSSCHPSLAADHPPSTKNASDCVDCHMPTRRTRDVIHVTMTDHRIARGPFDAKALLKPIIKKSPVITDIEVLPLGKPPIGDEADIYRMVTTLRTQSQKNVLKAYRRTLAGSNVHDLVAYLDLAKSQIKLHEFKEAEASVRYILNRQPDLLLAQNWLGLSQLSQGKVPEAIVSLKNSLAIAKTPDIYYNLALAEISQKQYKLALDHLDKAIAMRSNLARAWLYKGRLNIILGNLDEARKALVRTLEIDPSETPAYVHLVPLLRRLKQPQEAQRFLGVGLRVAKEPEKLQALNLRRKKE